MGLEVLRGPFLLPRVCPAELRGSQQEELHPQSVPVSLLCSSCDYSYAPSLCLPPHPTPAPLISATLASSCTLSLVRGDQQGKVGWV